MKTKITILKATLLVVVFATSLAINAQDAQLRYTFDNVITNSGAAGTAGDLSISPDVAGSATYISGPTGFEQAYQGDGDNSLETSWGGITGNQARTITTWVKINNDGAAKTIITLGSRPATDPNGKKFNFVVDKNKKLKIAIQGDFFVHSTLLVEDVWTFVAISHNGTDAIGLTGTKLYVDNVAEVGSTTKSIVINTENLSPARTLIGSQWKKNNVNYDFTTGAMDDIRVYDYELTLAQLETVKITKRIPAEFEDEEPEVEQGIDVKVDIPKKNTKSLQMLSGGERTLTSLAMLFAMSQVNPPPFLILDETDAALDESNSKRYGDMIKHLSAHSQLIIITHNRETMAHADVLYGITMGKDGTSKILSIKFDETKKEQV